MADFAVPAQFLSGIVLKKLHKEIGACGNRITCEIKNDSRDGEENNGRDSSHRERCGDNDEQKYIE